MVFDKLYVCPYVYIYIYIYILSLSISWTARFITLVEWMTSKWRNGWIWWGCPKICIPLGQPECPKECLFWALCDERKEPRENQLSFANYSILRTSWELIFADAVFTEKKHTQITLHCSQKLWIWTLVYLVHQINC